MFIGDDNVVPPLSYRLKNGSLILAMQKADDKICA